MNNSQHPLNPLNPKLDVAHYDDTDMRALKWESARVEATVKRLKLERRVLTELRKGGNGELTFEGFNERFPNFPVLLSGSSLPGVMTLGKKSMGNNRSVPVVSVSTDFPPGVTLQEFFLAQRLKLRELSGVPELRRITDDSSAEQYIDAAEIEPGLPAVFDVGVE